MRQKDLRRQEYMPAYEKIKKKRIYVMKICLLCFIVITIYLLPEQTPVSSNHILSQ